MDKLWNSTQSRANYLPLLTRLFCVFECLVNSELSHSGGNRHCSWPHINVILPLILSHGFFLALGSFLTCMQWSVLCWILKRTSSKSSAVSFFVQLSFLQYSDLWTLATLVSLDCELHLVKLKCAGIHLGFLSLCHNLKTLS